MARPITIKSFENKYDNNSGFEQSTYDKELIKMWSDISEKNVESINSNLNRRLMKDISNAEKVTEVSFEDVKQVINSKQMWDSKKSEWVPFDLWGAHFIVNHRKEYVALRIYQPCVIQPEFGPILKGWHSLDSSYLNEILKDKIYNNYYEILKNDKKEEY